MNFIQELKWRGLLFDSTPGVEAHLSLRSQTGYVGFDPSAASLHIGNLVQIMLLVHFQRTGHKPIALVGGATGMIGDPSGKSEERNLLSEEIIRFNESKIKDQLSHFLDFNSKMNAATLANNYDWFKEIKFLDFLRDVGKHLTVNYMMAKESVKARLETGISFTEFSYQLLQGYDFYWLNQHRNCTIQMGGSDQWGNITSGIELTRRKSGNETFAITSPLITRADGRKFGKTEQGNVWLDGSMTSPYKFYQFWLNVADDDASRYVRIFTLMTQEEISALEVEHQKEPGRRILQNALAKEITVRVHSEDDYNSAIHASKILFGQSTGDELRSFSNRDFEEIFEGVPTKKISKSNLESGIEVMQLFVDETNFFPSKGEARRTIQSNGASINKLVVSLDHRVTADDLINNRYMLLQKGKKELFPCHCRINALVQFLRLDSASNMNFENFIKKLKERLAQQLPGEEAQFKMAPARRLTLKEYYELRNRDPVHSAVLACLYPKQDSVFMVLMLRPSEQGVHSDQVSFPGGRFEEGDLTLEKTALREAYEEIGIKQSEVHVLGRLSPLYIPVSNYLVQPVVGFTLQQPTFIPNHHEVIRLIELDCNYFLDGGIRGEFTFQSGTGVDIEAPFYEIHQLKVWGATAMILSEFESILRETYFL